MRRHPRRRPMRLGLSLVAACATAAALLTQASARAEVDSIEPSSLPRGADPQVAFLVHDVIRDGDLRIRMLLRRTRWVRRAEGAQAGGGLLDAFGLPGLDAPP